MTLNEKFDFNATLPLSDILKNLVPPRSNFTDNKDFQDFIKQKRHARKDYLSRQISQLTQDFEKFWSPKILLDIPKSNPTNLTNPYWQWLVRQDISAYDLTLVVESRESLPLWSVKRMGQTCTLLPDGREILIGGEFEEGYDPLFWIYNDVIVKHPDGKIEIFGYPSHVFPPTDFHTTTLVGDEIWIIGSAGYPDERDFSQTSVYKLNIHTYKIEKVETRNSMGWVFKHSATLKDNQIIISSGHILQGENLPMRENFDDWALNLKTLIWRNLTNRKWQVFLIQRKDGELLHINEYKTLETEKDNSQSDNYQFAFRKICQDTGDNPDLALFSQLYVPPLDHEIDESEEDYDTFTIFIDGIKIRYVTDSNYIQVYIEGILPPHKLELLQENLRHKLSKLENFACEIKDLVF